MTLPLIAAVEGSTLSQLLDFANKFGGGVVVPIALAYLAYLQLRAKAEVQEVKHTLEESTSKTEKKLDSIEKTGEESHVLVNSNMGASLETIALLSRKVADETKLTADIAIADSAERKFQEHLERQAIVDAKSGRVVQKSQPLKVQLVKEDAPAGVVKGEKPNTPKGQT